MTSFVGSICLGPILWPNDIRSPIVERHSRYRRAVPHTIKIYNSIKEKLFQSEHREGIIQTPTLQFHKVSLFCDPLKPEDDDTRSDLIAKTADGRIRVEASQQMPPKVAWHFWEKFGVARRSQSFIFIGTKIHHRSLNSPSDGSLISL
jgi:hypothetical protein